MAKAESERKRIPRACDICTKRKTKCDGGLPCGPCDAKDRKCTYEFKKSRGQDMFSKSLGIPSLIWKTEKVGKFDYSGNNIEITSQTIWTHDLFLKLRLPDDMGKMVPWIEVFYTWSFGRLPVFTREFIDTYYYDLPIELLNGMFVSCMQERFRHMEEFKIHLEITNRYIYETLPKPTIYTLIMTYYHTMYCYVQQQTIKAATYMGLAIRLCHELQLHQSNDTPIYSVKTPLKQFRLKDTRRVLTAAWLFSYIQDFYLQAVSGTPHSTQCDFNMDILSEYKDLKLEPSKADKY
jgi:hypothetical protein